MDRSKIDWCDSTWNPVTGCLHGCEYCYARGIANRFSGGGEKWSDDNLFVLDKKLYVEESEKSEPYPYGFKPTFHKYRLAEYSEKRGRNIFVCSMADLFGAWVPDEWIEEIFQACIKSPQHNYLFLTKNPERYVKLQKKGILLKNKNMWYGASATDSRQFADAIKAFANLSCDTKTFISAEPLLEDITTTEDWNDCITGGLTDWMIVGAETGRRKNKVVPERDWIRSVVFDCEGKIPVFMKSSLENIWKGPLIQKYPEGMVPLSKIEKVG